MANVLPKAKQVAVLNSLVEGCSVRSTARLTDVSIPTVLSLMVRVGEGCDGLLDRMMRDLTSKRVECDEIWGFVQKKQKHMKPDESPDHGDAWTFVAFDPDSKAVVCFRVGKRDAVTTNEFIADLRARLSNRIQLTTDGLALYRGAVEDAFGWDGVDFAQLVKVYKNDVPGPGRYSPPAISGIDKIPVFGEPSVEFVSTSGVERNNLSMRMQMRRMTRLTNGHSKKLENHVAATALHMAAYNLTRLHSSIRATPAMAAGVTRTVWSMGELIDAALHGVIP